MLSEYNAVRTRTCPKCGSDPDKKCRRVTPVSGRSFPVIGDEMMHPHRERRVVPSLNDNLITPFERKALTFLRDKPQMIWESKDLGRALGVTWQKAAKTARDLEKLGYVKVKGRGTKMIHYEITESGKTQLA